MPRQRTHHRKVVYHFPKDFPQRLEQFKNASGLTWSEIGRRLGTNALTLRRWRGGMQPTLRYYLALVELAQELRLAHLLPTGNRRDPQPVAEQHSSVNP